MSVSHCTPDYYKTLKVLFERHKHELHLNEITNRIFFNGNSTQGYADTRIVDVLINQMVIANSRNYCNNYPDRMGELIDDDKTAEDYINFGQINSQYIKLSESKVELLSQAIYYWLYNTEDHQGKTEIYQVIRDSAARYSLWAVTKKMPYVWDIPHPGMEIKIMPCI